MKLLLIAFLLSVGASTAYAQTLQLEIVVFDRGERRGPETYPKRLDLSWPKNVRLLGEPPQLLTDDAPIDGEPAPYPAPYIARPLAAPGLEWWPPLPAEALTMAGTADRLRRHFGGRLLLHTGWQLPPNGGVLVKSEQSAGDRPLLMGYVRVQRGRYLELDTNLWVADFEPNDSQPNEGWPALPRWPGAPLAAEPPEPALPAEEPSAPAEQIEQTEQLLTDEETPLFFHEPYRVVRIVQLKESRRLKVGELNYLDHPRLGVLIQVTEATGPAANDAAQAAPR